MSFRDKLKKIGLPVLLVLIGFTVMRILVLTRSAPQKEARNHPGILAQVITVRKVDRQVVVVGTGTVQGRREITLTPQVSGRIVRIAPNFIAGGFFSKGEFLFKIEDVDYRLAVEGARAALAQAELGLAQEESNARVARLEWERLGNTGDAPNPLVLYEPQLKKARADADAARASVQKAELDLQRTVMTAPFNCRVRSEEIDPGQYVRSGTPVGTVAGTDMAEIVVPLPLEELPWLRIPRQGSGEAGSPATVTVTTGNHPFTWEGHLVRSLGEVDPRGRMARVVAAVDDPYHLKHPRRTGQPDLELGMFVEVAIKGQTLKGVIPIPATALRQDDSVWIADGEDKLQIRDVDVLRRERSEVLIRDSIHEGDRLVLTALQGAANGMKLRCVEQGAEE